MADTTWGQKVPEELKEKLTKAMEDSGLSGKDFLDQLMQAYEMETLKNTQPIFAPDIDELQGLTGRIVRIYTGMGERIESKIKDQELQHQEQLQSLMNDKRLYENKIQTLQDNLLSLKSQYDDTLALMKEANERVAQIEEVNSTNKALVQEYKEKNETMLSIVNEYKGYKEIIESLREELREEKDKSATASRGIISAEDQVNSLKKEIERMTAAQKDEIERVKEHISLERDKTLLEVRNEYQEKIAKLQDEYREKVTELLNRIENLQAARLTKPTKEKTKK